MYLWGRDADELVAFGTKQGASWQVLFAHQDRVGSVTRLVDAAGAVVERYAYDPYGARSVFDGNGNPLVTSAYGNAYGWIGRRHDAETGLCYLRHRYYSTALGRFMSEDPIGPWHDRLHYGNPYAYAGNAPLSFADPLGLQGASPWCDSVPGFLERCIQLIKWWDNEAYWGQRHCTNICRWAGRLGGGLDGAFGAWLIGVGWEVFEHGWLYPKVLTQPPFNLPPLGPDEWMEDIFKYNLRGAICGALGNKSFRECWCCCCRLNSGKDPCKKKGGGGGGGACAYASASLGNYYALFESAARTHAALLEAVGTTYSALVETVAAATTPW